MEIQIYESIVLRFFLRDADCIQIQKKLHVSVVTSWQ